MGASLSVQISLLRQSIPLETHISTRNGRGMRESCVLTTMELGHCVANVREMFCRGEFSKKFYLFEG
jgi:hypothetical protein